ncbi:MAG: 2-dehydro-3-deoxygalactonokinase [Clostridia bacterium]|nr:2-dehydro-3-deoxygalactonokinase [Clostridia bacterium]
MILTIDGGTTNTRLYLLDNGEILARRKLSMGIRDTLQPEGKARFHTAVADAAAELTAGCSVDAIVCSGMIGSETGLYSCPHAAAPISFAGLAEAMVPVSLPGISDIPFWFVPGVKTFAVLPPSAADVPLDLLAGMDIMRGEETELAGICARLGIAGERTFVLPGSHMKTVSLDDAGRITAFHTSLTGELLRAAAEHTILQASVGQAYPKTADPDQLRRGYALAREYGMAQALFKVRILDKSIGGLTAEELYAFLMGILLQEDVTRLIRDGRPVCIAGSDPFRSAYRILLADGGIPAEEIPEETADCASAYGAWYLWTLRSGK